MSDSVRPHRWGPTRLPRPWDSPGKNTGVGCHFLLQCLEVKSESEVAQSCLDSLQPRGLWPTRFLWPWDSPGKNTGVGCHSLLQGIFPIQGLNLDLLYCRRSLPLHHLGRPMYSILHSVISTLPGSFGYSMLFFCISHSKRTLENLSRQFPEVWMKLSPTFLSYHMPSY